MSSIKIEGGIPLKGTVETEPNKNSVIKMIPACVLASEPVTLHNVPKSASVRVMLRIFRKLGGKVKYHGANTITLNSTSIKKYIIDDKTAVSERTSLLFAAPLLARFGKAQIGGYGGCKLGNRPLDAMFQGLKSLGVTIDGNGCYKMKTKGLKGDPNIWLIEASVTGTENIILAAIMAKGKTVIYNAACEPHTQDFCNFLVSIGARIKGIGTNRLEIDGVEKLKGGEWTIIPDHIDVGGLIVAAAVTGGEITIKNAVVQHMTQILNYFRKINLKVEIRGDDIFVPGKQKLICRPNVKGDMDKIMDQPWPGYPVDLIPQAVVLAAKASESIRVLGVMYETQLLFVKELLKMDAKLILADSHQVITQGPSSFAGITLESPDILQCAHAMVLAGLSASGTTIIKNCDIIARRYPNLVDRLRKLGARIEKV